MFFWNMNFVELRSFKLENWWWKHESINSPIFTKMDLAFGFKATTHRKINSLHIQYLLGLLFSIKVKENLYRPRYTSRFWIYPNLNNSQVFKSSSCKFLSPVFYRCSLLWWLHNNSAVPGVILEIEGRVPQRYKRVFFYNKNQ